MKKELELWQFAASPLIKGEDVVLLVVAASSGSSPGRAGYKMAVAVNGELCGSIGGGVMEVNLVDRAKGILSVPEAAPGDLAKAELLHQLHQKNSPHSSGMICSGRQTVILKQLSTGDAVTVNAIAESLQNQQRIAFEISNLKFQIIENPRDNCRRSFSKTSERDFVYRENLGSANKLIIIGGGHCALALSELMSRLDFQIRIFDDRPELNTIKKNEFAHDVTILGSYKKIAEHIDSSQNTYVVVMTLGYVSDAVVIRQLIDRDFKYFGVLGSKAKMATLMKELRTEGIDEKRLAQIQTPIGLPINSRTPEEIAVSIAAEIISVKNEAEPPA